MKPNAVVIDSPHTDSRIFAYTRWDAVPVLAAILHCIYFFGMFYLFPRTPLWIMLILGFIYSVSISWNINGISHNFIHRPFFRTRAMNAAFSCYLSLLLGFPQSLWRARHLAHHFAHRPDHHLEHDGARGWRGLRFKSLDFVAALALWGALLVFAPRFVLTVYLPGYLCGLGLCALQGRYEHIRGTVSHYGRLYNILFFNDGYHVEHHAHPEDGSVGCVEGDITARVTRYKGVVLVCGMCAVTFWGGQSYSPDWSIRPAGG